MSEFSNEELEKICGETLGEMQRRTSGARRMGEFSELSSDEIRLLRAHRASEAINERPVDKRRALLALMKAVRLLAEIGVELDPIDGVWQRLLELIPKVDGG